VNPLKLPHLNLLLFLMAIPAVSSAQGTQSSAPSAAAPTSKPAQPPATAEKKKPKKVWTNDDLGSVKGKVSVVGEQSNSDDEQDGVKSYQAQQKEDVRQQQISMYRDQIQQLQGQIEATEQRINQLKNFKGENTSPNGGINPSHGYNMVPLADQVKQLEDRKKQLQAKIQDIETDAKKNGIEPGDLR
jgi:DNA repair exonuclease SbcCD ATPase subunit